MSKMLEALKNLSAKSGTIPIGSLASAPEQAAPPAADAAKADAKLRQTATRSDLRKSQSPPRVTDSASADPARRMRDLLKKHLSSTSSGGVLPKAKAAADPPKAIADAAKSLELMRKKLPPLEQPVRPAPALPNAPTSVPAASPVATRADAPASALRRSTASRAKQVVPPTSSEPPKPAPPKASAAPAPPPSAAPAKPAAQPAPPAPAAAPPSPLSYLADPRPRVTVKPEEHAKPAPAPAPRVVPARTISRPATRLEQRIRENLSHASRSIPYRELADRLQQDLRLLTGRCLLFACVGTASHADDLLPHVAALLAEEEREVLLIDADFSRAAMTVGLGGLKEPGLGDLFQNGTRGEDLVIPTLLPKVALLPAGRKAPPESIGVVDRIAQFLEELKERHSLILIDAGPHTGPLAPALARLCDATYLVVRLGVTDSRTATSALSKFRSAGARIMGCVATCAQQTACA